MCVFLYIQVGIPNIIFTAPAWLKGRVQTPFVMKPSNAPPPSPSSSTHANMCERAHTQTQTHARSGTRTGNICTHKTRHAQARHAQAAHITPHTTRHRSQIADRRSQISDLRSHLIPSLISSESHHISSHLIISLLVSSRLVSSQRLVSSRLASSRLASSHLISSHS